MIEGFEVFYITLSRRILRSAQVGLRAKVGLVDAGRPAAEVGLLAEVGLVEAGRLAADVGLLAEVGLLAVVELLPEVELLEAGLPDEVRLLVEDVGLLFGDVARSMP